MSTTSPPRHRPLSDVIGVPPLRDVRAPRWVERRPVWLVASIVLVILLVVSAVLRTRQLSGQLWFNEALATGIASQSFGGVLHAVRVGAGAPLYYLLLHFWTSTVGSSEADTRALSLLFALIAIPVGGWAGWSLGGRRAGLYGAALMAFSAVLTQYAEETQPYALLILLGLVTVTAFLHGFVYRRRRYLWLFALALEAAFYTQGSTALLAFGLVVALIVVVRCAEPAARPGILRDAAICAAAVVILYIPWLPATIHQIAHSTSPWHYVPLPGADVPGDLVGGERVDAALAVAAVMGLAPLLLHRSRRRSPEAVTFWALIAISVAGMGLAGITEVATPDWVARYFMTLVGPLLLLAALSSARTKIVGVFAIVLSVAFCANPSTFASPHKSDMSTVSSELAPRLHAGDVVAVAQPEQSALASYYLPSGLRWATTMGPLRDPSYMNWDDARARLQRATPAATLGPLVDSLRPGQQLLFVRPLTEGVRNWKAPWSLLVRRRAAQWGQLLTNDVANGTLTPVGTAPDTYPGSCCVADSAVLYRKAS